MLIGPGEEGRGSAESCIPHLFLIELPCMVPKARQREVQEGSTGGAALPCAHPAQSLFRSCQSPVHSGHHYVGAVVSPSMVELPYSALCCGAEWRALQWHLHDLPLLHSRCPKCSTADLGDTAEMPQRSPCIPVAGKMFSCSHVHRRSHSSMLVRLLPLHACGASTRLTSPFYCFAALQIQMFNKQSRNTGWVVAYIKPRGIHQAAPEWGKASFLCITSSINGYSE